MKYSLYNQVLKSLEDVVNRNDLIKKLSEIYPNINLMTIRSIYWQWMQRKVKKSYHFITQPKEVQQFYEIYCRAVDEGEPPGIILRLAKNIEFSSAMLAKIILEYQLNLTGKIEGSKGVPRAQVNKLLRDTTLIKDRDLSYEVYLCLLEDDVYGPFAEGIKHSIGHEYESLLKRKLEALNMSFQDETVLRLKGYDKTPDIKLDVPVAVDGRVINWIESKASFGDEESHKTYLKDQLWSYWNRFGPGLVIYWFGYIEELDEHTEKGILISDDLPKNITFMEPLS